MSRVPANAGTQGNQILRNPHRQGTSLEHGTRHIRRALVVRATEGFEPDSVRKAIDRIFDFSGAFGHAAGISGGEEKLNRAIKTRGVSFLPKMLLLFPYTDALRLETENSHSGHAFESGAAPRHRLAGRGMIVVAIMEEHLLAAVSPLGDVALDAGTDDAGES